MERAGVTNALVFVPPGDDWSDYGSVFPANSPWLDGDVVYALYIGPDEAERLRAAFPGRRAFMLRGTQLDPLP